MKYRILIEGSSVVNIILNDRNLTVLPTTVGETITMNGIIYKILSVKPPERTSFHGYELEVKEIGTTDPPVRTMDEFTKRALKAEHNFLKSHL